MEATEILWPFDLQGATQWRIEQLGDDYCQQLTVHTIDSLAYLSGEHSRVHIARRTVPSNAHLKTSLLVFSTCYAKGVHERGSCQVEENPAQGRSHH